LDADVFVSPTPPPSARKATESPWAPLVVPAFRALWIAQSVSNIGSWTQTVGAQWLLIGNSATLVTLV
jgi:hypothetical protein